MQEKNIKRNDEINLVTKMTMQRIIVASTVIQNIDHSEYNKKKNIAKSNVSN